MFNKITKLHATDATGYGVTRDWERLKIIATAALLCIKVGPAAGDDITWLAVEAKLSASARASTMARAPASATPRQRGSLATQAAAWTL